MVIKPLSKTKKANSNLLLNTSFQKKLEENLLFLSEIGIISAAFITFREHENHSIQAKVGLETLSNPNDIICFEELVKNNEVLLISDIKKDCRYQSLDHTESVPFFEFFAGFPITISELFTGTLCILDKTSRELSCNDLKIIKQSVSSIESIAQLNIKNQELQALKNHNRIKFQMFEENSKEILYQINLEGVLTYVSKNWTTSVGHELIEVIGTNFSQFIHPDDIEKCTVYFNSITLNKKNSKQISYRLLHKKGHYVWHSSCVQLFEKDEGPFYIGNCTDITEFIETEQKLNQQKDFYETILNSLPTDVVVFDIHHKYQYLNPVAIKNKELREFIIGKDDFEYAAHLNRDSSIAKSRRERFLATLQNRETSFWEETLHAVNDGKTYHNRKFTPVFNDDGSFKMMIGFSVNITESKNIEAEIIQSRELIKNILNNTAVGILVQGPNSEILENNLAACEMLGLTQDQLLGKTSFNDYWQVIHENGTNFKPEEHPVPQCIQSLKPVNNIVMGVHRPTKKDLVWLLVDAIPIFNNNQELLYVICSFNNITHQKNTEEALKISNERFTYATKATSDVIWDWEIRSENLIIGENYTKLFGHKINNKNNFLKVTEFNNLIHPDDLERVLKNVNKTLESKATTWYDEFRYLKSDGSYAYLIDTAYIIRNKSNKAIRMIGAQTDITTKKKVSEELRISEEKFKGAFEHSAVGMAIIDLDGFWIETNARSWEILGYSKEEFKKLTCLMMTHPDDIEADVINKKRLTLGLAPNFNVEKRYIHKNKSIVWVHLSVSVVRDNEGAIMHYIPQIIDITERKKIEAENKLLTEENFRNKAIQLNEAKNRYRLLADNTLDLVCLHNLDTTFQYVSPSVYKLLGYSPEYLIGKSPLAFTHPDDVENLQENISILLTKKEDVTVQTRYRNTNGQYVWFETKANLVKVNGIPVSFHSGTREITVQKEAEESIKKTLAQEQKLNELRTNLVSTISHEFRTPMTTIRTSAELIEMYTEGQTFKNSDRLQKHLYTITNEIDRIVELMNTVLTISREDSGKTNFSPIPFDLKQVCLDVIETSYSNQKDGRTVKTAIQGNLFPVLADRNLMEYALFNVLNNAFKYSEGFGDIVLSLFTRDTTVSVEIIDFGIGIPKIDQHKLFNTFFRARNTDGIQGTGLGLYIVKTFTEKNSGIVKLESKLGKGTKITLEFPLHHTNEC
ncbi:PAS domain S-box-containing protein [Flavobacterium sp. CG_9.1]|uniref:PAS domain-containing protein n=1 Tax=Flavobacterium sp. CG_9.1 TaxID=2787728 RepID=UPI0018C93905|nr:PAS domain S-box protein [Flavobacterium sp. CG_9.1]MBG6060610.1 PAS domain S-box-containing protein [Flavobacterium sp. CG_9.1]